MEKRYGIRIVFSRPEEVSINTYKIINFMIEHGFYFLDTNYETKYTDVYFEYCKAYDKEDMTKVVQHILDTYSDDIEEFQYFKMTLEDIR